MKQAARNKRLVRKLNKRKHDIAQYLSRQQKEGRPGVLTRLKNPMHNFYF